MKCYWELLLILCCLHLPLHSQLTAPTFQTGHYSKVKEVFFHPNNKHLISCGDDGKIIVWDIQLGLQRAEVLGHKNGVLDLDLLNDSILISLGPDNDLKTWSFPDLKVLSTIQIKADSMQAFAVIDAQKICMVGRKVLFYDLKLDKLTPTNHQSKGLFKSVAYNNLNQEALVSGPADNYAVSIKVNQPVQFQKYFIGNIHKGTYGSDLLLMATTKGALIYYNAATQKKRVFTLDDDLNYISDMDVNNGFIAVGTAFGFTSVFDVNSKNIHANIGMNGIAIAALAYSKDGKWLAVSNTKGIIYLYDTENYKLNKILKGGAASIIDLKAFEEELIIGYSDGVIRYLNLPDNQLKSNSIKLDRVQEQNGENYCILSIDSMANKAVYFTVLKTNRHHIKTSLLKKAEKIKAIWHLSTNKIVLIKQIKDGELNRKVKQRFSESKAFVFKDYSNYQQSYRFNKQDYVIDSNSFSFFKIKEEQELHYPVKHSAPISGLQYLSKYQIIVSFSQDGSIRFWNTNGEYLGVLYLAGQYSFFYLNKENYYFASKEILDKIAFVNKGKLFGYEQYDLFYNRPDEVMKDLNFFETAAIIDYRKAYLKRLEKLGVIKNTLNVSEHIPEIVVDYFGDYSTKNEAVNFSLSMADLHGNVAAFSYLINGIEKRFQLKEPTPNFEKEITIILGAGINQIEFYCVNEQGVRSLLKKKIITCEKNFEKPNLFLVSIGVTNYLNNDFDLKYARKDAQEISAILSSGKTFENVFKMELFDSSFTKDKYQNMAAFLKDANINDVIVFFYAGHGVLDQDFNYYLATHDMDFNQPKTLGLPFDSLEVLFEGLSCRNKLMMIDACFSGEIDKSSLKTDTTAVESIKDIQFRATQTAAIDDNGDMGIFELSKLVFADLRVSKGTNILSSSSGIEYALEGDKWGNGLFTYVLKKGLLEKEADLNEDKQIRIMELQVYLRETVATLSKGNQNPVLRKENIKNNFVLW